MPVILTIIRRPCLFSSYPASAAVQDRQLVTYKIAHVARLEQVEALHGRFPPGIMQTWDNTDPRRAHRDGWSSY